MSYSQYQANLAVRKLVTTIRSSVGDDRWNDKLRERETRIKLLRDLYKHVTFNLPIATSLALDLLEELGIVVDERSRLYLQSLKPMFPSSTALTQRSFMAILQELAKHSSKMTASTHRMLTDATNHVYAPDVSIGIRDFLFVCEKIAATPPSKILPETEGEEQKKTKKER